ncbi:MAG: MmgE/PrpD family protein [Burkholderiales bacterium]
MTVSPAVTDERVTARVAEWISSLKRADIPEPAWTHAKLCLLDALGCALFGSRQPWGRISAETALELSPGTRASLWGHGARCGIDAAAMANGTATHGFELDDIHLRASMHPGAVTIPAAFALAEAHGKSPAQFLTAVVAGYEIGLRIGIAVGLAHGLRGHHTTGTVGTLAAAATCANLLSLSAEATADALGIAATQAAGLHGARTGAMSKRFHAGRAAQSGILAAALAKRGFTGSRTALEQPFGGFFSTLCEAVDLHAVTAELGSRWEIREVGFKAYASCGSTHTTVDAIDQLMRQGISARDLKELRIYMSKKAVSNVGWKYAPAGVVAAQMNAYYTSAVKLLDGEVFIDQFAESRLADPQVLAMIGRIRIAHEPAFDAGGAATRHAVRVEAELKNGDVSTVHVEQRRGSARFPLSREDIEKKFRGLAKVVLTPERIESIFAAVDSIDRIDDMQDLASLMRADSPEKTAAASAEAAAY